MLLDWESAGRVLGDLVFEEVEEFAKTGIGSGSSRLNARMAGARLVRAIKNEDAELEKLARAQLRASFELVRIEEADRMDERIDRIVGVATKIIAGLVRGALVVVLFASIVACSCPGTIKASEIEPLLDDVLDRYEDYIEADESIPVEGEGITKADVLHSSKILRDIVEAATKE